MSFNAWSPYFCGPVINVITPLFEDAETREERLEFERFRRGRDLQHWQHVTGGEILCWLHRAEPLSKFWREHHEVRPPFCDHVRAFASPEGRIVVLMPYANDVRKALGLPVGVDEQLVREGALKESRKFAKKHGLDVRVLRMPGWHSRKTILIEYRKRSGEKATA